MLSASLVRCKNEALKNLYFKSIIKCFKRVKRDKWPDSPCTHFPHRLLCYNKCAASSFIQWWLSVIYFLIVTASISKLLHSWLFIDLSEHHYTALTSKFNNFFNRSSTMSNNVFNVTWNAISKRVLWLWVTWKNIWVFLHSQNVQNAPLPDEN